MKNLRDGLNVSQKWVVVIAFGAALLTVGRTLERQSIRGGWFGYAPNTSVTFGGAGALVKYPWLDGGMWLALVLLWAGVSLWIVAGRPGSE